MTFLAQAEGDSALLPLTAAVTGTYELHLASEAEVAGQGDTHNIRAIAGQERQFILYL